MEKSRNDMLKLFTGETAQESQGESQKSDISKALAGKAVAKLTPAGAMARERLVNCHKDADFDHWGKLDVWTPEQGICLLLGKDPDKCESKYSETGYDLGSDKLNASFKKYVQLVRAALIATQTTGLGRFNYPCAFLDWARKKELPVPPALHVIVEKHSLDNADWKKHAEELQSLYEKHIEKIKALHDNNSRQLIAESKKIFESSQEILAQHKVVKDELAAKESELVAIRVELAALKSSKSTTDKSNQVNGRSKPLLYWMLGIALHKAWKSAFQSEDKGNALATHILNYAETNNIHSKGKQLAIAKTICEIRESILIEEIELAAQHLKSKPT